jgi:hypothetical protein
LLPVARSTPLLLLLLLLLQKGAQYSRYHMAQEPFYRH